MTIGFSVDPEVAKILIGLFATMILGVIVGCLVRRVGDSFGPLPLPRPGLKDSETPNKEWKKLIGQRAAGGWIGIVEQPLFFAALWANSYWWLLPAWLVMKTAFYWQSANFTAFPESAPKDEVEANYLVAKRQLGTHHVATALVGTGANILAALIGVAIGRAITIH